jgi:hypothetical protein
VLETASTAEFAAIAIQDPLIDDAGARAQRPASCPRRPTRRLIRGFDVRRLAPRPGRRGAPSGRRRPAQRWVDTDRPAVANGGSMRTTIPTPGTKQATT